MARTMGFAVKIQAQQMSDYWHTVATSIDSTTIGITDVMSKLQGLASTNLIVFGATDSASQRSACNLVLSTPNCVGLDYDDEKDASGNPETVTSFLANLSQLWGIAHPLGVLVRACPNGHRVDDMVAGGNLSTMVANCDALHYQIEGQENVGANWQVNVAASVHAWQALTAKPITCQFSVNGPGYRPSFPTAAQVIADIDLLLASCTPNAIKVYYTSTDLTRIQCAIDVFNHYMSGSAPPPPSLTVTGIKPTFGPAAGGTSITVYGTAFATGVTAAVGGVTCTSNVLVDATPTASIMTAVTGAHAAGLVGVFVAVPIGPTSSPTLPNAFTYGATPTIALTSITPTTGPPSGGQSITLVGTNFAAGVTVKIDGVLCTNVVLTGTTSITALTPAHSLPANVNVVVTNTDTTFATLTGGYTYFSPLLTDPFISQPIVGGLVTAATTATQSFGVIPSPGHLLVAVVATDASQSPTVTTGAWQNARSTTYGNTGTSKITVFYRISGASEPTAFTVTTPSACHIDIQLFDVTNVVPAVGSVLDVAITQIDAGSSVTTLAIAATPALSQTSEFSLAVVGLDSSAGTVVSWSNQYRNAYQTSHLLTAYNITSALAGQSTTAVWSTSRRAAGMIVTFKGSAGSVVSNQLSDRALAIRLGTQADVNWWNARQADGTLLPSDIAVFLSQDAALASGIFFGIIQIEWRNWLSTSDGHGFNPSAQSMIPSLTFDCAYYDPESLLTYATEYAALGGAGGSIEQAADDAPVTAGGGITALGFDLWYGGDSASYDSTIVSALGNVEVTTAVVQGQFLQLQGIGNTNQNTLIGAANFDGVIGNKILAARAADPTTRVAVMVSLDAGDATSCYATLTHMQTAKTPGGVAYGIPDVICIYQTGDIVTGDLDSLVGKIRPSSSSHTLTISSLSPNSGSFAGGDLITLNGSAFIDGATATFLGAPATEVSFISSTKMVFRTSGHAAGTGDVVITLPDSTSFTFRNGFTYLPIGAGSGNPFPLAVDVLRHDFVNLTNQIDAHAAHHNQLATQLMATESIIVGPTMYNVKGNVVHPAMGDGGTDDRLAIQSTLDAIRIAGGGICVFPPAPSYAISAAPHPTNGGFNAGLVVGANTTLRGSGMGVTPIKLLPNQGASGSGGLFQGILMNYNLVGGDDNIVVEHLTLDGNAANQPNSWWFGSLFYRARFLKHLRVKVVNVKGSGNAPPGERFAFEASGCADVSYDECIVQTSPGAWHASTGFSADLSTNVSYKNCWAIGILAQTDGHGFTHNGCNGVVYEACFALLNASNGFNSEVSNYVKYDGCFAGMYAVAASGLVYPSGAVLGNGTTGFNIASAGSQVDLINCSAIANAYGVAATGGSNRVSVIGGTIQGNSIAGLFNDGSCTYLKADRTTRIFQNGASGTWASGVNDIIGAWQVGDTIAANLTAGSGTGSNTVITSSSTTIPANTLNDNARALRIRAWGTFAANANNKGVALAFGVGGIQIAGSILAGAPTNGASWQIDATIMRTSVGHQIATSVTTYAGVANAGGSTAVLTQNEATDLTLSIVQITGSNTSGDVLFQGMTVEVV